MNLAEASCPGTKGGHHDQTHHGHRRLGRSVPGGRPSRIGPRRIPRRRPDDAPTTSVSVTSAAFVETYAVGGAESVTIGSDGTTLTVLAVDPADGWSGEIERSAGHEVEVDFRDGTVRMRFDAQFEDGEVRIRIERDDD